MEVKGLKKLRMDFLVALVVIKGRIIQKNLISESEMEIFDKFLIKNDNHLIHTSLVLDKIHQLVVPLDAEVMEAQRDHLDKYLDLIIAHDKHFLTEIVDYESVSLLSGMVWLTHDLYQDCLHLFVENDFLMKFCKAKVEATRPKGDICLPS
jgi:hypothetical protein